MLREWEERDNGRGALARSQCAGDLAVTAGWGHAGKGGVTMPGRGRVGERPALPPTSRPCHLRSEDAFTGSYVRVGNTDQRMTQYQVYGYLSGRGQPTFDEEAVPTATPADLDDGVVLPFLKDIESRRPRAFRHAISTTDRLRAFGIVADDGGSLRPTLSGLLLFGKYPQQFEPQLVITFMQYQGVDERDKGPRGERLLDNRKFEGTVPEVVAPST